MQEKRASSLTEFIHNQTKTFREELQAKYQPARQHYTHALYSRLVGCFHAHLPAHAQQQLDSNAMLDYYACYKRTLRTAKDNNKRLHDQALAIEIKLKQCVEVKSALTKSTTDFQNERNECYQDFADKYRQLYDAVFGSPAATPTSPSVPSVPAEHTLKK